MRAVQRLEFYSEDQPRDDHGRFTDGNSSSDHVAPRDSPVAHGVAKDAPGIYWHGTPSGDLRGGSYGLHLGTHEAAREALEARIGKPAVGDWDGTRKYGETLLSNDRQYTVFDTYYDPATGTPGTSHLEVEHHEPTLPAASPTYSDGSPVSMESMPDILPFRITGTMTNTPDDPHEDFKANGYLHAAITRGNARNGYYYTNVSEDEGSVSIVVPNGSHVTYAGKDGLRADALEFEFDEAQHPRDERGRFSSGDGDVNDPGHWDRSGDEPRWVQSHAALLDRALSDWKGWSSNVRGHLEEARKGEPQPASGSGKQMRAQAEALLQELRENSRVNPVTLYRGANWPQSSTTIQAFTEDRKTAEYWARLGEGAVIERKPGEVRGLRIADYVDDQLNEIEKEWIVLPERYKTGAAEFYSPDQERDDHGRFAGNGDSTYEPKRDPAMPNRIKEWGWQFPNNTFFRSMHRDDLARVREEGKITSRFAGGGPDHTQVWVSDHPSVAYLDPGEVIVAIYTHPEDHEVRGTGGPGDRVIKSGLPADRIVGVFDPEVERHKPVGAEFYAADQPRDDHGRFATVDGVGSDPIGNSEKLGQTMLDRGDHATVFGDISDDARGAIKSHLEADLAMRMSAKVDGNPALQAQLDKLLSSGNDFVREGLRFQFEEARNPDRLSLGHLEEVMARMPDDATDRDLLLASKSLEYVDSWMASSTEGETAIALQQVVAEKFGAGSDSFDRFLEAPIPTISMDVSGSRGAMAASLRELDGEIMSAFVDSEYEATQEHLRSLGIGPNDEVTLYRGMGWNAERDVPATFPKDYEPKEIDADLNPASSWTVDRGVAQAFAVGTGWGGGGFILSDTIPARSIISTAITGRGAVIEGEALVANDPHNKITVERNSSPVSYGYG